MTHKFKTGSQWKTRGGWRAVVVDVSDENLILVWHERNINSIFIHEKTGIECSGYYEKYDLVEPFVEPIKRTFWSNVYHDRIGLSFDTYEEAKRGVSKTPKYLDTIQIDYVQGKTHYVAKGE